MMSQSKSNLASSLAPRPRTSDSSDDMSGFLFSSIPRTNLSSTASDATNHSSSTPSVPSFSRALQSPSHASASASQSPSDWDKLHLSLLDFEPGLNKIAHYQWNLFLELRKDIDLSFGYLYGEVNNLHKKLKRLEDNAQSLDQIMESRLDSSVRQIETSIKGETKHVHERIDYLRNYFQEQGHTVVARLPKLEDNENDETNNDNESETQNTSSCSHNETTESILHRNEIQSSLFNSEENEDNHSPSTCTTVDSVTPSINQNPAKSNVRSQTSSYIETSSTSTTSSIPSSVQQTPISNAIKLLPTAARYAPKVNNGY